MPMKIYPSTHKIKSIADSHVDTDLNIPLAYVNVDYSKYKIEKLINEFFNTSIKKPLILNDSFENSDIKIFNDYGEELNTNNLLTRKDDKYIYYPDNAISFVPKFFLWKATIKKALEYSVSNVYDIKIKYANESTSKALDSILAKPSERSLVPPNIKINNDKVSYDTFTNLSDKVADFVFIKNVHGGYYDVDCVNPIDIYEYLKTHTNIWIGSDDPRSINSEYGIVTSSSLIEYAISKPILNSNSKVYCNTYFNLSLITKKTGIKVHNIFNNDMYVPVLILEYENSGFVILSHSSLLDDSDKSYPIIFEVLMYVYLNSYASTELQREWITYKTPDYEVVSNVMQSKKSFVSNTSLSNYFNINDSNMSLVNLTITDDETIKTSSSNSDLTDTISAVKCIGKINNKLIFELDEKISIDGYIEPSRPLGWKSIYHNEQVHYLNDIHYLIKDDLTDKIFLIENKDNLLVKIYAFRNSELGLYNKKDFSFTIPFVKSENDSIIRIKEASFTVYIKSGLIDYCYTEDYDDKKENQHELFIIKMGQTQDAITIHDIRQLGGGLPEDEGDNFNLFDIGHIDGRPYRSTGTLVITMPTKYKKYKENILQVLQKYMVGEDYPIIYFEDKED